MTDVTGLLCCPVDGSDLEGDPGRELGCAECGAAYPAEDGILNFLGAADLSPDQRQEVQVRDEQAEQYEAYNPPMSDTVELPLGLASLGVRPGDVVAEVGCGVGRFTRAYAPTARLVVALDFSAASLRRLRSSLDAQTRARALLVQADATRSPLRAGAFDRVAMFNVLHHIPSAAARREALGRAAALPRHGGPFVLTTYHWSLHKQHIAARGEGDYAFKEGHHANGLYYYNFEEHELRGMFEEEGLKVDQVLGLIMGFRGAGLLGPLLAPLNRLVCGRAWCIARSHYILVRGRRLGTAPLCQAAGRAGEGRCKQNS
jgi:SAM-dependent methyltransferase